MSLSVQVINGVYGLPAAGVTVRLDCADAGSWAELAHSKTGEDGEIKHWDRTLSSPGNYRLEFGTDSYFASLGVMPFYPVITIEVRISDPGCPHRVRLLLTPSSYLAYWQR